MQLRVSPSTLLAAAVLTGGCGSGGGAPAPGAGSAHLDKPGRRSHSIQDTSPMRTPVSTDMAKGAGFSTTYQKPGKYEYICGIHNYMMGSVTVR